VTVAGVRCTFLDANHCPGAVMIVFQPPGRRTVLHTGDCRSVRSFISTLTLTLTLLLFFAQLFHEKLRNAFGCTPDALHSHAAASRTSAHESGQTVHSPRSVASRAGLRPR